MWNEQHKFKPKTLLDTVDGKFNFASVGTPSRNKYKTSEKRGRIA